MGTALAQIKSLVDSVDVKKRFNDVLGAKANQFISSIVSAVTLSPSLQACDPKSVISAALVAASFDLPIDQNLGFSAMVPYNCKDGKKAQFQIMAKGFIQLAIRSSQYTGMNYSEVYEDELFSYNPVTKELVFAPFKVDSQRKADQSDKIIGYYAWIQLKSGFRQTLYMTMDELKNHARKYSASYKLDIKKGWTSSKWSTDFDPMAKKTVIKLLLSKWGILSVNIQRAINEDQKVYDNGEGKYLDNDSAIDVKAIINDPFKPSDKPQDERPANAAPQSDKEPKGSAGKESAGEEGASKSFGKKPSEVKEDENGKVIE